MTIIHAPDLYEPKLAYRTPARDAHLRANVGIDPVLLGLDLGLHPTTIRRYQRILGLRLCVGHGTGHVNMRGRGRRR